LALEGTGSVTVVDIVEFIQIHVDFYLIVALAKASSLFCLFFGLDPFSLFLFFFGPHDFFVMVVKFIFILCQLIHRLVI